MLPCSKIIYLVNLYIPRWANKSPVWLISYYSSFVGLAWKLFEILQSHKAQSNIKWRFELKDFAWSYEMVESINQT